MESPILANSACPMLKFWKKKPPPEKPADDSGRESDVAQTAIADDARHGDSAALEADSIDDAVVGAINQADALPPAEDWSPTESSSEAALERSDDDARIGSQGSVEPEPPTPARRSWRERLSGSGFARGLSTLFTRNPVLDDAFLDELETCLITADVGVTASSELVDTLRARVVRREFADAGALLAELRRELVAQLKMVEQPLDVSSHRPFVVLVVGVNGVGKTTTIGKLARRFRAERRAVVLAAGDTFRAAAVEQLQAWGVRNEVPVVAQGSGADSASVIFDALQAARSRGSDVLIADTAGRLHTQSGLMDELAKIRRVLGKIDSEAPHEVLLVIDGTTGQNAISQVRQFKQSIGVSGLVVSKLDGTAKGGVVFALAREFGLPIRYVGLGESADDLRVFDAAAYVDGLLPAALAAHG